MRTAADRIALTLVLCAGCTDEPWPRPAPVPVDQFVREFHEWRDYRRSRLIAPGPGPVTWIGLWEVPEGTTEMGADSTLPIVLPATHSARLIGTIDRTGAEVRFEPAPGARVQLADSTAVSSPIALVSDRNDDPTTLALGSLRLRLHGEPGTDRLWLRAWDEQHPARETFALPESFPPDTAWRVAARFDPYAEPREYRVVDIEEGTQAFRSPGDLVFRVGRGEHRLAAFAEAEDTIFFVMMWDSTATTTTYQAGRYMRVPFPDSTGWTMIDFNRAYSPPCVFTPYSTCAFAPPENRLTIAVLAGEKRYSHAEPQSR
jgi:uncharacterized protein (DUF1684 family)